MVEARTEPQEPAQARTEPQEPAQAGDDSPAGDDSQPSRWTRVRRSPWTKIVVAVAVTRAALTLVLMQAAGAYQGSSYSEHWCWAGRNHLSSNWILRLWGNWDSSWYRDLAQRGYPAGGRNDDHGWAFQPLYSMLMRLIGWPLGGSYYLAGLIVSTGCLIVACELVRRLALLEFDEAGAWRTVWLFLALPGSFLFSAVLTESLFVTLALGAFLAARTRHWVIACTCVSLVAATRSVGLLVVVPVALEYLAAYGWSWRRPLPREALHPRLAAFLIAPIGLGLWSLYVRHRTGDALYWQHVQFTVWKHKHSNPFGYLWDGLTAAWDKPSAKPSMVVFATLALLAISTVAVLTRRMRPSSYTYMLIILLPPLTLGYFVWQGMYRFIAPAFPMAFLLARLRSNDAIMIVIIGLAVFQGMLATLWTACSAGVVV